jgi:NDP-sugar pyrophosphorylase family protein
MKIKDIMQIPLLNDNGKIVGLEILQHILEKNKIDNPVFLLAGGFGKRLLPLTKDIPKPLIKIGNVPIIENTIIQLSNHGFSNFIISTHYKAEMFKEYFGNGKNWGVNIEYIYEKKPLGTAGSLGLIKNKPEVPFVVMNSDIITKINFETLIQYHIENKNSCTVCVQKHEIDLPYGIVLANEESISHIEEKPKKTFLINAGIYVFSPHLLDNIKKNEYIQMTDFILDQIKNKEKVSAFPIHEYWIDIGKKESLEKAEKDIFKN